MDPRVSCKRTLMLYDLYCRLVINLIVINIVSCLFLLPSVAADLSTAEEPIQLDPQMNGTDTLSSTGPIFALCVWGTAFSSFVSNASILAVLAVGEYKHSYPGVG